MPYWKFFLNVNNFNLKLFTFTATIFLCTSSMAQWLVVTWLISKSLRIQFSAQQGIFICLLLTHKTDFSCSNSTRTPSPSKHYQKNEMTSSYYPYLPSRTPGCRKPPCWPPTNPKNTTRRYNWCKNNKRS